MQITQKIRNLCERATNEQDPEMLAEIIQELNAALDEQAAAERIPQPTKAQGAAAPNPRSPKSAA